MLIDENKLEKLTDAAVTIGRILHATIGFVTLTFSGIASLAVFEIVDKSPELTNYNICVLCLLATGVLIMGVIAALMGCRK